MRQRKQYRIADFAQLCKLFVAGNGEFHFFNTITTTQFNLKFTAGAQNIGVQSRLYVCYSHHNLVQQNNKLFYFHIGRYNFVTRQLELRTAQVVSDRTLRMFLQSLDWVFLHINTGVKFGSAIECYYSGCCCRCGKPLVDTASLQVGLGIECQKKVGVSPVAPVLFSKPSSGV